MLSSHIDTKSSFVRIEHLPLLCSPLKHWQLRCHHADTTGYQAQEQHGHTQWEWTGPLYRSREIKTSKKNKHSKTNLNE